MSEKKTIEALEIRIKELEDEMASYKDAEDSLRESEEKYSRLFHFSNDGIFLHDLEGTILDANQRALDLFGYTIDELKGIKVQHLHPEETLEKSKWAFETIMEKGFVQFDILFVKKNGEAFPAEVSSRLFPLKDRQVIQGIVRDITERKNSMAALQESENRYKSLFNNNHSVMLLIDPDSGYIVDANPAATSYYGYTREEITRKKISEINTLSESITAAEMEQAKMELRNYFLFQHRLASGDVRDVEVYSGPIVLFGKKLLYSIVHDITDRKRAEEERNRLIADLETALKEIKTLRGILPICSFCKKIRDDEGYWEQVDVYIHKHSQADFSHGICPECAKKHYPNIEFKGLK